MKKNIVALMSGLSMCVFGYCAEEINIPINPTVQESLINPLGQNLDNLRFSWQLPQGAISQRAYQLEVIEDIGGNKFKLQWQTGKVESSESIGIAYKGAPIKPRQKYFWRVKIWDKDGKESDWSEPVSFESGLIENSDWRGNWISTSEPVAELESPRILRGKKIPQMGVAPTYLRTEFNSEKEVVSARLYVACRGIFKASINGKEVGNDFLSSGWTDYSKRIQTDTYDVTKLIKNGENALGAILCDGWYAGRLGWEAKRNFYGQKPELLVQLEIKYADGSMQTVVSDAMWKSSKGAVVEASLYDGETYDARLAQKGWNCANFDDSSWKKVAVSNVESTPKLEPRRDQPIVAKNELSALSVKEIEDGKFVFDFGQNMVGMVGIKIPSKKDMKVTLRFAEMLNKDGTLYTDSYRSARSKDHYTCATDGIEEWIPQFTFHGFRYVELSGFPKGTKPSLDWVKATVIYNDMPLSGSFVCSLPKINMLQSNIQWGQRSNFISVPTDCPQRDERLGWTGDAQVFIPTAAFNMNVGAFFNKWMLDMRDSQTSEGRFPHVSPDILNSGGSAAWGDAGVICPWESYLAYGDKQILRDNYQAMKKWVDFQKNTSKDLIRPNTGFGDWLQPNGKGPGDSDCGKDLIGTAYFIRTADIVSRTAKILGFDADSKAYANLAEDVRTAFQKAFVDANTKIKGDCQTAYLLALAFDILPENQRSKAFENLVKCIEKSNWHLNTGFVGTPLLNPVLTRFGRMDIAYRLLKTETYPSWIYPINQGATTMWERWNSYSHDKGFGDASMNSFNHYAYGAIGQWLYKDVAGLWYDESAAGYKNIIFAPKPGGGLTFASASHETPYGLASSNWNISDKKFVWNITIPENTTGSVSIPSCVTNATLNGKTQTKNNIQLKAGVYEIIGNCIM